MVRNMKGGNKHKKFARNNVKDKGGFSGKLRKSEHPEEIYASVSKIFGNGRVEILCNDGETRHCVIRNKFRGKGKRDNEVFVGTIILAGRRGWETPNVLRKEVCDLLYVYGNAELNKLRAEPGVNISLLQSTTQTQTGDDVDFFDDGMNEMNMPSEEEDEEEEADEVGEFEEKNTIVEQHTSIIEINNDDDIIDVDDI